MKNHQYISFFVIGLLLSFFAGYFVNKNNNKILVPVFSEYSSVYDEDVNIENQAIDFVDLFPQIDKPLTDKSYLLDCLDNFLHNDEFALTTPLVYEQALGWIENQKNISYCQYFIGLMISVLIDDLEKQEMFSNKIVSDYYLELETTKSSYLSGLPFYIYARNSNKDSEYYQFMRKSAEKQYSKGIAALARWVFLSADIDNPIFSEEERLFASKNLQECIKSTPLDNLDKETTLNPIEGISDCYFTYAMLQLEGVYFEQDIDNAEKIFKKLSDLNHDEANMALSRLYCYYRTDNISAYNSSRIYLEKAISLSPKLNMHEEKLIRLKEGYCGYKKNLGLALKALNDIRILYLGLDEADFLYANELLNGVIDKNYEEGLSILKNLSIDNYDSAVRLAEFYLGLNFETSYQGIGIELDKSHKVIKVYPNSSAQKNNIEIGDNVISFGTEDNLVLIADDTDVQVTEAYLKGDDVDKERNITIKKNSSNETKNLSLYVERIFNDEDEEYYDVNLAEKILLNALNIVDENFSHYEVGTAEYYLGSIYINNTPKQSDKIFIDRGITLLKKACEHHIKSSCYDLGYFYLTNEDFINSNEAAKITAFLGQNDSMDLALELVTLAYSYGFDDFENTVSQYIYNPDYKGNRVVFSIAVSVSDYENKNIPDIPQANYDSEEMNRIFLENGFFNILGHYGNDNKNITHEVLSRISRRFSEDGFDENDAVNQIFKKDAVVDFVFYFSGHGISYDGKNYLIPSDFPSGLKTFDEARPYLVSFNKLVRSWSGLNPKGHNLFILDACRSISEDDANEVKDFTFSTKQGFLSFQDSKMNGLSPTQLGKNNMIVYATSPGKVALYNAQDKYSIFTKYLVEEIDANPTSSMQDIMLKVQSNVINRTNSEQIPWVESSMTKKFYFTNVDVNEN